MQSDNEEFTWLIAGEAGYGISTAGEILSHACMHAGLHVFTNSEYPSLIRGGHNTFMVRVSEQPLNAHSDKVNMLVALNKESIRLHGADAGGIIYDPEVCGEVDKAAKLWPVPFSKIIAELGVERILMNSVALGASFALMEFDFGFLEDSLRKILGEKSKAVGENIAAAQKGYSYIKNTFPKKSGIGVKTKKYTRRMLMTGNDALALGAIAAGCKFAAIYPMTPITPILHRLAAWQRKYGVVVLQPEDEISGINAAIGASFAGVRSLVATSGGGFSLMSEAFGMSGITETPLVVIWGQRSGPSTGLPTRTAQSDLQFALHASHGEFPRVVLAPGDVEECFSVSAEAFNLADRWQIPVVVLVDKHVCECFKTVSPFDLSKIKTDRGQTVKATTGSGEFARYKITESGVSPRAFPGQSGRIFRAVSDEHDEFGYLTEEPSICEKMQSKRLSKLEHIAKAMDDPQLHGPKKADITIMGWGSTKGSIIDAMQLLKARGISSNFLQIYCIWPFPSKTVGQTFDSAERAICIEQNATGQLASLIREQTGKEIDSLLKCDGRQWTPEEIAEEIAKIVK